MPFLFFLGGRRHSPILIRGRENVTMCISRMVHPEDSNRTDTSPGYKRDGNMQRWLAHALITSTTQSRACFDLFPIFFATGQDHLRKNLDWNVKHLSKEFTLVISDAIFKHYCLVGGLFYKLCSYLHWS